MSDRPTAVKGNGTKVLQNVADRLRRRLRYASPVELRRRSRYVAQRLLARQVRPVHESTSVNVYHCCVQRTGSQWIRHLLADPRVFKFSGLRQGHPSELLPDEAKMRELTRGHSDAEFPPGTIVSPLYIDFPAYKSLPKPQPHRAFCVTRDPRDIVVSWYFSVRYSHTVRGRTKILSDIRRELDTLSLSDGLLLAIHRLEDSGLFDAQRSWSEPDPDDREILMVRYEDLTGPGQFDTFSQVFAHCDIRLPANVLAELLTAHSFERMSGRSRGDENKFSHLRKGVAGDWRNYIEGEVAAEFVTVTQDLVEQLGYEPM